MEKSNQEEVYLMMLELDSEIRGRALSAFVNLEFLVDIIIKKTMFNGELEYKEYMRLLNINSLTSKVKKSILKNCLYKIHILYGANVEEIIKGIDNIFDRRNALAHYLIDPTDKAHKLFELKGQLSYIKAEVNPNTSKAIVFDKAISKKFVNDIKIFTRQLYDINELIANIDEEEAKSAREFLHNNPELFKL